MIDIHAHILPEIDDGSKSIDDSLKMLKDEAEAGVTDVILTPHYRSDFCVPAEKVKKVFADFKQAANDSGLNVNLYLGQEIFANSSLYGDLERGEVLPMNGTGYVLVEFSPAYYQDISEFVYGLIARGYTPIVAHLERYPFADEDMAKEIKAVGALIQINAYSLSADAPRRLRKKMLKYVRSGIVDFVASDVHSIRTNYMKETYEFVAKKAGADVAERLFVSNPRKIIGR